MSRGKKHRAPVEKDGDVQKRGVRFLPQRKAAGERLLELRERAGLTQDALAEKAGIHGSQVSRFEDNKRGLSIGAFLAVCDAIPADPVYVWTGKFRRGAALKELFAALQDVADRMDDHAVRESIQPPPPPTSTHLAVDDDPEESAVREVDEVIVRARARARAEDRGQDPRG